MRKISPMKAGLAIGLLVGLWHLGWAALVALSWAQPVTDFVLRIHFIEPFIRIQAFHLGTAITLVAVTALIGFLVGAVLAAIWNLFYPADRAPMRHSTARKAA